MVSTCSMSSSFWKQLWSTTFTFTCLYQMFVIGRLWLLRTPSSPYLHQFHDAFLKAVEAKPVLYKRQIPNVSYRA